METISPLNHVPETLKPYRPFSVNWTSNHASLAFAKYLIGASTMILPEMLSFFHPKDTSVKYLSRPLVPVTHRLMSEGQSMLGRTSSENFLCSGNHSGKFAMALSEYKGARCSASTMI